MVSVNLYKMRKTHHFLYFLAMIAIMSSFSVAKGKLSSEVDKTTNTKKLRKEADKFYNIGNFGEALGRYKYVDSLEPNNAEINFKIGICTYASILRRNSIHYLLKARDLGYESRDLHMFIGRAYHSLHEFDSAIVYYDKYLALLDTVYEKNLYNEIVELAINCENGLILKKDSLSHVMANVGDVINTPYAEYAPVVSADERTMIFTARWPNSTGGKKDDDDKYYEDIYITHKDEDGNWQKPEPISENINTEGHDACIGMSMDAQKIFLYSTKNNKSTSGNLYMSYLRGEEWSKPELLQGGINTKKGWESSASLSANEDFIFFSSDREGGYGGSDIYVAKRVSENEWGEPINMGPLVNSSMDEDMPLIHPNGKLLIFSSKGHNSMGGYDVFTTFFSESDSMWTKPQNIGFPINTAEDDLYFGYTAEGTRGYFSSYRPDSYGERDIYWIDKPLQQPLMLVFKGNIKNEENEIPLEAEIILTNIETEEVERRFKSNSSTGDYTVVLEYGKYYNVSVNAPGHFYYSENVNIPSKESDVSEFVQDFFMSHDHEPSVAVHESKFDYKPDEKVLTQANIYSKDIALNKLEVGGRLVLKDILFPYNSSYLNKESRIELNNLYNLLINNPNIHIEIQGHTDNVGGNNFNLELSENRAHKVMDYLLDKGIDSSRLVAHGYGEKRPLAPNSTVAGRQMNRRTEFEIVDYVDNDEHVLSKMARRDTTKASFEVWHMLPEKVHFMYHNGDYITDYSKERVILVAELLKTNSNLNLKIVGHNDFEEEGEHIDLSNTRAKTVYEFLLNKGIPDHRIEIRSAKDVENFVHEEDYEKGVRRRRVEFFVVSYN